MATMFALELTGCRENLLRLESVDRLLAVLMVVVLSVVARVVLLVLELGDNNDDRDLSLLLWRDFKLEYVTIVGLFCAEMEDFCLD